MAIKPVDIQFGSADLYINGRNVGAVTDVRFVVEIEKEEHRSGQPSKVDKVVVSQVTARATANLKEINPLNLRDALGLTKEDINVVTGSTTSAKDYVVLTYSFAAKLLNENLTEVTSVKLATTLVQPCSSSDTVIVVASTTGFSAGDSITVGTTSAEIQSISGNQITLTGAIGASYPVGTYVVRDTAYTSEDDYTVDLDDGTIKAVAGGAIPDNVLVEVSYSYKPMLRAEVPIGKYVTGRTYAVHLVHKRDDGKMIIYMPRGQVTGALEFAFGDEFHAIPVTIDGLSDPSIGNLPAQVIFEYE